MARRGRRCHPRKGGWWHVSRRTEPCCWLEKSQLGLEIPLVALRCQDRSQGLINVTQRRKAWGSQLSSLPPCRILSFQMRPRVQIQPMPHYSIPGFLNLKSEPGADKGK